MNENRKLKALQSFENDTIPKVVIKNCIPSLIAMVMIMIYNLADTFFLGLTHNDLYVTAVSFATPLFMVFMSLGLLFGVGGMSVISRALGAGDRTLAKKTCSFCMWSCVALGIVLMVVLWIFLDDITVMLGASEESKKLTSDYLRIVVGCGVFTLISSCFSNILRAEGQAMKAMTGSVIGNLLNVILDPIMILAFGWGVKGAAIATVIGNVVAAGYYMFWLLSGKSTLSINPKYFSMKNKIFTGVMAIGISASISNLLVSVSNILVNGKLASDPQGDMLVAGYGVTSKVNIIVILVGIGIGSGIQPFIGYCFGAKKKKRLVDGIKFSSVFAMIACVVVGALCYILAEPIVHIFLTNDSALNAGVHFTRILMTTAWSIGLFAVCQNSLQAIGAATPSLISSLFRHAILFIPTLYIMAALLGIEGIIWAQPVSDVASLVIVVIMMLVKVKKIDFTETKNN